MNHRLARVCSLVALGLASCTGRLGAEPSAPPEDAAAQPVDLGRAPMDAVAPPRDVPPTPIDRGTIRVDSSPPVDVGTPARDVGTPARDVGTAARDVGAPSRDVVAPVDVGVPAACAAGPLATPIEGCRPPVLPSTGDPRQDCVDRINQFRRECQCLPPLQRWTDGEECADSQAMIDQQTRTAHNGFRMRLCNSGSGQNECPGWLGWGSVASTLSGCLQQMWDEGPGDFYGPPPHGHYLNMSSTRFTRVACGYYTSGGATTAVQNFQ